MKRWVDMLDEEINFDDAPPVFPKIVSTIPIQKIPIQKIPIQKIPIQKIPIQKVETSGNVAQQKT